ncbi:thiamine monophosphate kinase, partial [Alcaligenes faecalis subsp. faecalis NCIB 8687]
MISITVLGEVPAGQALRRSAARPGDDIWLHNKTPAPCLFLAP